MKELENIQLYLSEIPNINYGGCGISALAMYLHAKNYHDIEYDIIFLYARNAKENYLHNISINKDEKAKGATHIILHKDGVYFDCLGSHNPFQHPYLFRYEDNHYVTVDFLRNAIKNGEKGDFDRKYIKEIEGRLNIKLGV